MQQHQDIFNYVFQNLGHGDMYIRHNLHEGDIYKDFMQCLRGSYNADTYSSNILCFVNSLFNGNNEDDILYNTIRDCTEILAIDVGMHHDIVRDIDKGNIASAIPYEGLDSYTDTFSVHESHDGYYVSGDAVFVIADHHNATLLALVPITNNNGQHDIYLIETSNDHDIIEKRGSGDLKLANIILDKVPAYRVENHKRQHTVYELSALLNIYIAGAFLRLGLKMNDFINIPFEPNLHKKLTAQNIALIPMLMECLSTLDASRKIQDEASRDFYNRRLAIIPYIVKAHASHIYTRINEYIQLSLGQKKEFISTLEHINDRILFLTTFSGNNIKIGQIVADSIAKNEDYNACDELLEQFHALVNGYNKEKSKNITPIRRSFAHAVDRLEQTLDDIHDMLDDNHKHKIPLVPFIRILHTTMASWGINRLALHVFSNETALNDADFHKYIMNSAQYFAKVIIPSTEGYAYHLLQEYAVSTEIDD